MKEGVSERKNGRTFSLTMQLVSFSSGRKQADAKVSANRELTCMKSIFNRCIEWKTFQGENPARAVKLVKEPKNKVRFLSHDEEKRLLEAALEPLRTILLVGIYTGLRLAGEALRLRWQDVDLQRGTLTVQASYAKNGETRSIPLSRALRDVLAQLKQRAPSGSEFAFLSQRGTPFRSIRTAFTTACRHANLPAVSPHVLRHTFRESLGNGWSGYPNDSRVGRLERNQDG